ncbi:hypothetical protein [Paraburkholderia sp. BCC1884]|uniref:hypothetical protein n=1 Tax=Paraburkholderia sp. BCC1884 TaxID=2562668 RepID=UPI0011835FC8|nr:hypothetical protein [Paraburkholderia sp. BCC1884]
MSTIFVGFGGAANQRPILSALIKRMRVPLEAWSPRRRWTVALLIALAVFALGAHGWIVADLGGIASSRAALRASVERLAEARRTLAQLPALRAQVAAVPAVRPPAAWSSADDVRVVSELAARSGVTLLTVEPGAAIGEGAQSERPLQLAARTDFVHLMAFLRGLSDLPVLIVPVDVTVKRVGDSLAVSAALRVFSALRPVASSSSAAAFVDESLDADDQEDVVFFDPFAVPSMFVGGDLPDVSQLRLVGLLHDRVRGLALLDTADGVTTVASGQQIGTERVTGLDALSVTLAKGGATRTLSLTEAS